MQAFCAARIVGFLRAPARYFNDTFDFAITDMDFAAEM